MNDNDDWDDIMMDENNPYDNPDLTFESEDSAFQAGIKLALENEDGSSIDLENDIDYPSMIDDDIKKAFKSGVNLGSQILINRQYGDEDEEEVNVNTLIYCPEDYCDENELEDDE